MVSAASRGRLCWQIFTRATSHQVSQEALSIPRILGAGHGEAWLHRREYIRSMVGPEVTRNLTKTATHLTGRDVYAKPFQGSAETLYDVANARNQVCVRGECDLDGTLIAVSNDFYTVEAMYLDFYSKRPGAKVLDVGCNTGRHMSYAMHYSGSQAEVYGLELSQDSVDLARDRHGENRVFQGDASDNFVDKHSWRSMFSVVQCTAVLQHMTPDQVKAALYNMSLCLAQNGELLLTFKDAPTKHQLLRRGMEAWADDVFTADIVSREEYLRNGFLRAVMWDDDYYPGVTTPAPPSKRDLTIPGPHLREFVFYSLKWVMDHAGLHGLRAQTVEVLPDSKIPYSALLWKVVFVSPGGST